MEQLNKTKKCIHCQSEIPIKASICPVCKKKQAKSGMKWVVMAVVAVFALAYIFGISKESDEPSDKKPKKVESIKQNDSSKKTEKKDDNSKKEENKVFVVGDVVKTSDLKIKFISAKKYKSDNEFIQPKKGNVYYKADFEFKNTSDSDQNVSSYSFKCYADGYDMEQAYIDELELDATLSPGKKTKGSVFFEVPKKSKEITLEYECNFWTEDKVVFKVK